MRECGGGGEEERKYDMILITKLCSSQLLQTQNEMLIRQFCNFF